MKPWLRDGISVSTFLGNVRLWRNIVKPVFMPYFVGTGHELKAFFTLNPTAASTVLTQPDFGTFDEDKNKWVVNHLMIQDRSKYNWTKGGMSLARKEYTADERIALFVRCNMNDFQGMGMPLREFLDSNRFPMHMYDAVDGCADRSPLLDDGEFGRERVPPMLRLLETDLDLYSGETGAALFVTPRDAPACMNCQSVAWLQLTANAAANADATRRRVADSEESCHSEQGCER